MKTIDHSFPSALLLLSFLVLLTHCTPLQKRTSNVPTTLLPQTSPQPETPPLSPEEQLERFNRFLDQT